MGSPGLPAAYPRNRPNGHASDAATLHRDYSPREELSLPILSPDLGLTGSLSRVWRCVIRPREGAASHCPALGERRREEETLNSNRGGKSSMTTRSTRSSWPASTPSHLGISFLQRMKAAIRPELFDRYSTFHMSYLPTLIHFIKSIPQHFETNFSLLPEMSAVWREWSEVRGLRRRISHLPVILDFSHIIRLASSLFPA